MAESNIDIENNPEYIDSLKSIETENLVDRVFYRPLGFRIAKALKNTPVTPNFITISSFIVGIAGAWCFYYTSLPMTVLGILLLVSANIMDCIDGQLARLTHKFSALGRILDGMAGDFWFITLYVALSLRLYAVYGNPIVFLFAVLSMLSHFTQAFVTDYYKTLHLWFISPDRGKEFTTYEGVRARYDQMERGVKRFFFKLYVWYTYLQTRITPELGRMVSKLDSGSVNLTPEDRKRFRVGSRIVMKLVDLMTFNGRTIPLFICALTGYVWFYFVYEIIFLNIVLGTARKQHEMLCSEFVASLESSGSPVIDGETRYEGNR